MSGWEPASAVRQAWHSPQPVPRSHCSAAANAMAALDRPEPGGPVNSHAWVIPWPATARCRVATVSGWPTSVDQTPVELMSRSAR